jgi:CDP-glycerol glycerophosphotransferase
MKIVYSSFDGRYSDNPRALYERYSRRGADEHVWLCHPAHRQGFPPGVATVTMGSSECIAALESADLVIANTHIEVDWQKKPGATYVQTWHGTPLKRVHHDVLWAPPGRLPRLDADVERWDYLVSPNSVSTPRLREAFRFSGEMLETGYPRNDVLTSPRAGRVRARMRKSLGIGEDTVAVLYAPTWRDDEYFGLEGAQAGQALDLDAFEDQLGQGHHLLLRLHPMMTDRAARNQRTGVRDVSYHPDVQELYLAADVLVTDYSSAMFDFAVTGKPILFYAYDFEKYRDSLRGFYFDFTPVAPGPILRTSADVIDELYDLTAMNAAFADRYAQFRRTFCHYDDGHAADRLDWLTRRAGSRPALQSREDSLG